MESFLCFHCYALDLVNCRLLAILVAERRKEEDYDEEVEEDLQDEVLFICC